jgi:hypothetical protein
MNRRAIRANRSTMRPKCRATNINRHAIDTNGCATHTCGPTIHTGRPAIQTTRRALGLAFCRFPLHLDPIDIATHSIPTDRRFFLMRNGFFQVQKQSCRFG